LEEEADRISELTAAASEGINLAIEGLRELAVLRAAKAAAVPDPTDPRPSRH
jgi:hypothetical protein